MVIRIDYRDDIDRILLSTETIVLGKHFRCYMLFDNNEAMGRSYRKFEEYACKELTLYEERVRTENANT